MITMLKYTKKNMKFTQDTKHTSTENKSGNFWGGCSVTLKTVRRAMVVTEEKNWKGKKDLLSGRGLPQPRKCCNQIGL